MFDTIRNTWHCHCAQAKQACVHKAIAKWHLFQTQKELFTSNDSDDGEESDVSEVKAEMVTFTAWQHPPQNEDLGRMVNYIHSNKRIPTDLPATLYGLSSETQLPMHLVPKERVRA